MDELSERQRLIDGFAAVINQNSRENISNTPDFILAEYLVACLHNFETASLKRESWYGKTLSIGSP